MKNATQTQIDEEMGYFFGFPKGTYSEVLRQLGRTQVNSCRTSSIPLAEFWQPANLATIQSLFAPYLPGFDPAAALKFFEFPTEAVLEDRRIGCPSMTDLMVLGNGFQMAVEGKFTEYVEYNDQTIRDWFAKQLAKIDKSWTPASRERYLHNVLRAWFGIIREANCTGLVDDDSFFHDCMDMSYQFLHRTASACHKAGVTSGTMPVLAYQIFFDAYTPEHIQKKEEFKADLRRWAAALKLQNMKFLILSVPITNAADVEHRFKDAGSAIFDMLREESVYTFDFGGIDIETIVAVAKEGR